MKEFIHDAARMTAQPPRLMLAALVLFTLYVGYGLATPWLDRQHAAAEAVARIAAQQATLARYQSVTVAINAALEEGMARDRALDRMRVAVLHAPATRENLTVLRWDITNSLTKPGHVVGVLATDLSVADWADYFPLLLAGRCGQIDIAAMKSEATMARIREMHIDGFVVCPIVSPRGALLGALFGSWDIGSPPPPDMAASETKLREVADKIGGALAPGG